MSFCLTFFVFNFFQYGTDSSTLSKSSSTSSTTSASKYSSLSSTYRPSYSGLTGIYRSPRTAAAAATSTSANTTTSTSSYTRPSEYTRSSTSTAIKSAGDETKERKSSIYSRTPSSSKLTNDDGEKEKKTYTRSYTSLSDLKSTESSVKPTNGVRKEPEVPQRTSFRSRLSSSTAVEKSKKEEKGPPITFNTRYKTILPGRSSRDPSPSITSSSSKDQTLSTLNASKDKLSKYSSLTSSSASKDGRGTKSRDPSPSLSSTSRRGSATSATQTALQRISAYRDRERLVSLN